MHEFLAAEPPGLDLDQKHFRREFVPAPSSPEYFKNMTEPHLKLGERFRYMNYGYLWYKPFDDREVYAAIGDSGNIIYASKEQTYLLE